MKELGEAGAALRMFAVAAPGLEDLVQREVCMLSSHHEAGRASHVQSVPGGVEFRGDLSTLASANLHLRCASRVLLRLTELRASDFVTLQRRLAELPWDAVLPTQAPVELVTRIHSERCRLYHSGAITDCIAEALTQRGHRVQAAQAAQGDDDSASGAALSSDGSPATATRLGLWLRGQHDRFTVSVDTSGALLHQRGYRQEEGAAPLRETLAAAIVQLAGFDAGPLCDPMCGSGTLVIEAALLALRRAPGLLRRFACASWPCMPAALWAEQVEQARAPSCSAERRTAALRLWASDHDPQIVAIARRNAERAGVAHLIEFSVADVGSLRLPSALPFAHPTRRDGGPPGLVICNPPYGRRIADPNLGGLYRKLARLVRSAPGWRLALLSASPQLARLALRHGTATRLHSGGLPVALYLDPRRTVAPLDQTTAAHHDSQDA